MLRRVSLIASGHSNQRSAFKSSRYRSRTFHTSARWRRRSRVKGLKPTQDKITRLAQQSAKIEAGMVFLPNNAPWLETFEKELIAFPNGKHDDQVDSLSQFLRSLDYRPVELQPLKLYESKRWLWAKTKEDQALSTK